MFYSIFNGRIPHRSFGQILQCFFFDMYTLVATLLVFSSSVLRTMYNVLYVQSPVPIQLTHIPFNVSLAALLIRKILLSSLLLKS